MKKKHVSYLSGYPQQIQDQVDALLAADKLADYLLTKYPHCHALRSEKQLYQYTMDIKNQYIRKSPPLSKVRFDDKIDVIHNALGMHSQVSRVQGNKLKAKRDIKVASVFKNAPLDFLKMILVHELAHFKESDHNRAFYNLCRHMQPDYHQIELDLRLYLTYLQACGQLYEL
ncbi:MAG: putative metal-dependent hydrolase [Osedax symbiont Rs2]|nr:MAG: putative metal-dependent hydrolase [Osedax symbiont Rs2]